MSVLGKQSSCYYSATSCISLCTILWNVNFTTCTWNLSYPPPANISSTKICWHAVFQSLFWLAFLLIRWSGSLAFTHALVHAIYNSQFSLPLLHTHASFLLYHLCIQRTHLHSICQHSHLVRGLLLLKSNEIVKFSGINSNCSQSTGHCTCIFTGAISKPYAEDWGFQKSRIRFIKTEYLSIPIEINAYFHSKSTQSYKAESMMIKHCHVDMHCSSIFQHSIP